MPGYSIYVYMANPRIYAAILILTVLIMALGVVGAILWMFREGQ